MNNANQLHQILLQPTDVLFFRDGRPMDGSLAGHTAAWPLPDVISHALHAALHRAGFSNVHAHRRGRSGNYSNNPNHRDRNFGCLLTAGPFPVQVADKNGMPIPQPRWFFPRPRDAQLHRSIVVTLQPVKGDWAKWSSLPKPLQYAVANTRPPTKEVGGEPWISPQAFQCYLENASNSSDPSDFLTDSALADTEATIGIAIDPATGTTGRGEAAGKIYSAHYLRLREGFRLGLFAEAHDKEAGDLIRALFNDHPQSIVVGGQQRLCTAHRSNAPKPLPLPQGLSAPEAFKSLPGGKFAVKWVVLSPAIWPEIKRRAETGITDHPGGWLPNWVCPATGSVLLKSGDTDPKPDETREAWRRRVRSLPSISARLVAAIVPKPIIITGWALPNDADRPEGGAKSTHFAVPAGAVYYFEADSAEAAAQLAAALNWHGPLVNPSDPADPSNYTTIRNRRSTLLGEKGFGLGVCGTWQFYRPDQSDQSDPSC
jgi:hypothetical protein